MHVGCCRDMPCSALAADNACGVRMACSWYEFSDPFGGGSWVHGS